MKSDVVQAIKRNGGDTRTVLIYFHTWMSFELGLVEDASTITKIFALLQKAIGLSLDELEWHLAVVDKSGFGPSNRSQSELCEEAQRLAQDWKAFACQDHQTWGNRLFISEKEVEEGIAGILDMRLCTVDQLRVVLEELVAKDNFYYIHLVDPRNYMKLIKNMPIICHALMKLRFWEPEVEF